MKKAAFAESGISGRFRQPLVRRFFLAADTAEGRRRLSLTFPLNLPFNLLSFWGGALHFQAPRLPYAGRRQLAPHIFGGEMAGNLRGEPDL